MAGAFDSVTSAVGLAVAVATATYGATVFLQINPLKEELAKYKEELAKYKAETAGRPEISDLSQESRRTKNDAKEIDQTVRFVDHEGDATMVVWMITDSDGRKLYTTSSTLKPDQTSGTDLTGTWHCNGENYTLHMAAIVTDKQGHTSAPWPYLLHCD